MEENYCGRSTGKMEMNVSDDWTFVEDANAVHNELLNSICMDMSASQATIKAEEFAVFQDVSLLPLVDITEDEATTPGTLVITKYELVFADKKETEESQKNHLLPHECDPSKVPLHSIAKIEINKQFPNMLEVWCKDLRYIRFRFESINSAHVFLHTLQMQPCWRGDYFAFHNNEIFPGTANGWTIFNWEKEFFDRLKVHKKYWRLVSNMNHQYEWCRSYPSQFIVPASLKNSILKNAAKFRTHNRLPVLCWYNSRKKASLTRCSQPMVGLMQMRSPADEAVIQAISDANPSGDKVHIIDCRAWVHAVANTARGAGTEKMVYYPNCTQHFMNIDNIHTMRDSFKQIAEMCRKKVDYRWFQTLEATRWLLEGKGWMDHLSTVLKGAVSISEFLLKGSSVLVHCSDGWDRTSQLCALAQILLDPYYRTIEGFEVLIEKEWLAFGHKFNCRCGHNSQSFFEQSECSPIFLQFIDCVFQLHRQFESAFEFNEQFLITLMDHVYSCKYGTFLYNSEKLRHQHDVRHKTISVWTYMNHNKQYFVNPFFLAEEGALTDVATSKEHLIFWSNYYLRFSMNNKGPLQQYLNRSKQIKDENERLGRELEELKERLEAEEAARCVAEQRLLKVHQEKKELEHVMQGVQCTVYRSEGGEKPYLVARISSPNKDLVNGFCDDLRNLKIIEDYCTSPVSDNGSERRKTRRTRRLTAGIGDEGWTNLFEDEIGCEVNETTEPETIERFGKKRRTRRKRTDSVTIEEGDGCESPKDCDRDMTRGDNDSESEDDEEPPELVEESNRGRLRCSKGRSEEEQLIKRAAEEGGDQSACEAALALRNEVVTLELSSEEGSWRLPVHFAACLHLLGHYLNDYGLIPTFKWPKYHATLNHSEKR